MLYGTKEHKKRSKSGELKFTTGKTVKLTPQEVYEFEVWVRNTPIKLNAGCKNLCETCMFDCGEKFVIECEDYAVHN